MQLNLEELPNNLFYERWRKNQCEKTLINAYINFSTSDINQQLSNDQSNSNQDQDYQYMLTRLLQKVQRFVIQNPTVATTLYSSFNETFISEVEKLKEPQISNSKVVPTVKNPLIVRGKGRPTNKRVKSTVELANAKSNSKKKKTNENAQKQQIQIQTQPLCEPLHEIQLQTQPLCEPLHEIQIQTQSLHEPLHEIPLQNETPKQNTNSKIYEPNYFKDLLFNELNLEENQERCLYCDEILPNPLPLKVSKYLNDIIIGKKSACTVVEQFEFCRVHRGEGIVIPNGTKKGYPLHIDFEKLPNRIINFKSELLKIIKGQKYSEYRVDAIKRIQEIGPSKVNNPLFQINYFEFLQPGYYGPKGLAVILKTLFEMFVQTGILTKDRCSPQSSSQYVTQVLAPEVTLRLIAEDYMNISLNTAKEIMMDSVDFGLYVHHDDDN